MKEHFEMLAAYNAWVNQRLYDAVAKIADEDYRADRGAFFRSLHGTLNHILIGDRIWMHVFTGEGERPTKLDAILYDDFRELRVARSAEDARIISYIGSLRPADFTRVVRYRPIRNPTDIEHVLAPLLIHFFNHQTHHRGQAHCILTGLTCEAPSFDLVIFQRHTGIGLLKGQGGTFSEPERRAE